jgi:adenylate cyclase
MVAACELLRANVSRYGVSLVEFHPCVPARSRGPLNGFILAGISAASYFAARYHGAVEWAEKAVELRPGLLGAHRVLCASLAQAGQANEAALSNDDA